MNCPYCSAEMKKGYIDQTDFRAPLEWYPADRGNGILISRKRNIKLTFFSKGYIVAYHCGPCKKLIIDHD